MFPFNLDFLNLNRIIITLPGILVALTLHEFAHGYSAYLLGDPTAKHRGRLSLNPIAHIDPFGFFMLVVAGFGWAKPVPINPNYFKKYKLGTFIVSVAGVVTNLILALILTLIFGFYINRGNNKYIIDILFYGININLVLAVFNLFPIPPLDGSKVILTLLPRKFEYHYYRLQKYFYALLVGLLYFGVIDRVLFPIVEFLLNLLINHVLILFI